MKKLSKRLIVAFALAAILVISVTAGAFAAGPNNGDCPNDGVCPNAGVCPNGGDCLYDGDGPADGSGLQYQHGQMGAASGTQTQQNKQANATGNCYANEYCHAYKYGNGTVVN